MKLKLKFIGLLFVCLLSTKTSNAQQEGFLGEVKMFAGNFPPRGWAFCNGQLMPISQNTALFSIIGTIYGGDGRTTFALPDFRGRVAVSAGSGPGLSTRIQGSKYGSEYTNLNILQLPSHSHTTTVTAGTGSVATIKYSTDNAVRETPQAGDIPAVANFGPGLSATNVKSFGPETNTINGQMINTGGTAPNVTVNSTGSNQAVLLSQPTTTIRYIICIQGTFPSRN
ncbi:phage tail protein [Tenacibaculum aiptasiae]|uniref:phage tail protein n=1 Tax=Tenacibaculum aiptasiae TaxID=426481 RepID=UPI003B5B090E